MALTRTAQVNAALRKLGHTEELVKGKGYFYFVGGDSMDWDVASVYVYRLSDLTLEEWVSHHKFLKGNKR